MEKWHPKIYINFKVLQKYRIIMLLLVVCLGKEVLVLRKNELN